MPHNVSFTNIVGRAEITNTSGHQNEEIDSWTEYWRTGASESCIASPEMKIRLTALWDEFVDDLSDGSRILDVATGNGTVALNCISRARTRKIGLQVDAVDAADIKPKKFVKRPGLLNHEVNFFGGVQIENLPFADGCFAGVVSQFGFEYADEEPAVSEVSRVLAPGGKLRLIIHAHDGAISNDIGVRLERLHSVLAENGPVSLVLTLARAAENGDTETLNQKTKYMTAATELTRTLAENPLPDDSALFYSTEFLNLWARRNDYRPADLRRSLEQGWFNANGTALRQSQMLRVARSEQDIGRIYQRFEEAGLIMDMASPIHDHIRNVQTAWILNGRK